MDISANAGFVDKLNSYVKSEGSDSTKYLELAKLATSEDERKAILNIAADEVMHRATLEAMLLRRGETLK